MAEAAWGGLQDSAPRAGLLGLHARAEGVTPGSWEDPALVQVWFRKADYLVPAADVGLFTIGTLPRDAERAAALQRLGRAVAAVLDGEPVRTAEVARRVGNLHHPNVVRGAACTGHFVIRWDTRFTWLVPAEPADVDPEDARLDLARRFLHWHGPATPAHFTRWAGVLDRDATRTWTALRPELAEVHGRSLLADDLDAYRAATPVPGVRLLPMGDPWLQLDAPKPPPSPIGRSSKEANSLTGRILVDAVVVGSWSRAQANVALDPWLDLSDADRSRIEAEAHGFAGPLGREVTVRWLR